MKHFNQFHNYISSFFAEVGGVSSLTKILGSRTIFFAGDALASTDRTPLGLRN